MISLPSALLDQLAMVFAQAAVDALLSQSEAEAGEPVEDEATEQAA